MKPQPSNPVGRPSWLSGRLLLGGCCLGVLAGVWFLWTSFNRTTPETSPPADVAPISTARPTVTVVPATPTRRPTTERPATGQTAVPVVELDPFRATAALAAANQRLECNATPDRWNACVHYTPTEAGTDISLRVMTDDRDWYGRPVSSEDTDNTRAVPSNVVQAGESLAFATHTGGLDQNLPAELRLFVTKDLGFSFRTIRVPLPSTAEGLAAGTTALYVDNTDLLLVVRMQDDDAVVGFRTRLPIELVLDPATDWSTISWEPATNVSFLTLDQQLWAAELRNDSSGEPQVWVGRYPDDLQQTPINITTSDTMGVTLRTVKGQPAVVVGPLSLNPGLASTWKDTWVLSNGEWEQVAALQRFSAFPGPMALALPLRNPLHPTAGIGGVTHIDGTSGVTTTSGDEQLDLLKTSDSGQSWQAFAPDGWNPEGLDPWIWDRSYLDDHWVFSALDNGQKYLLLTDGVGARFVELPGPVALNGRGSGPQAPVKANDHWVVVAGNGWTDLSDETKDESNVQDPEGEPPRGPATLEIYWSADQGDTWQLRTIEVPEPFWRFAYFYGAEARVHGNRLVVEALLGSENVGLQYFYTAPLGALDGSTPWPGAEGWMDPGQPWETGVHRQEFSVDSHTYLFEKRGDPNDIDGESPQYFPGPVRWSVDDGPLQDLPVPAESRSITIMGALNNQPVLRYYDPPTETGSADPRYLILQNGTWVLLASEQQALWPNVPANATDQLVIGSDWLTQYPLVLWDID